MSAIETGLRTDRTALAMLAELIGPSAGAAVARADGDPPGRGNPTDPGHPTERWVVLPRRSAPRYLVRIVNGRSPGAVRFRASTRRVNRAAARVLSVALRSGAGALFPSAIGIPGGAADHPSLASWLGERMGGSVSIAAIALGSPRANRKPVLQLVDGAGRTVAFGKLAIDEHTAGLVRSEAEFLTTARSEGPALVLPELLLHDRWKGLDLIVLRDLGGDLESADALDLTPAMVRAIASLGPVSKGSAIDSGWWQDLSARIARLAGDDRAVLERGRRMIADQLVDETWEFGTWHGDLAPWNARIRYGSLLAWDWERAAGPVPLGLDAVHNRFQVALTRDGMTAPSASRQASLQDAQLFGALGYGPAAIEVLVAAYLLELRTRLAEDASYGSLAGIQRYADSISAALAEREAR